MDAMFQMNPALGVYSPPRPRKRRAPRGDTQAAKAKRIRDMKALGMTLSASPGLVAYDKARRAAAGARAPAQRARALARRLRDPVKAARYRKKMLGRQYHQGGRLLGAGYKAPLAKRRTNRMARKQGGVGLKKGDLAGLLGMDTDLMRMGDYASKASLMDYADMMRKKARAAYVARKRRLGKSSAVRTPMTAAQKKARAAQAYRLKKQARMDAITSISDYVNNHSSPMSALSNLSDISADISAQFSPGPVLSPPRPRVTRASAALSMAKAAAAAERATRRRSIPATTRRTRSMAPLRRTTRSMA